MKRTPNNPWYPLTCSLLGLVMVTLLGVGCDKAPSEGPAVDLAKSEKPVRDFIQNLQKEITLEPRNHQTWGKLAMAFHVHGFRAEAIECYDQAIELKPDFFNWHYYSAILLYDEMGSEKARDRFTKALQLNSQYLPALIRFGNIQLNTGDDQGAETSFSAAAKIDSLSPFVNLGLAQIALARNTPDAVSTHAQNIILQSPEYREGYSLMAQYMRQMGNSQKAFEYQSQADSLKPLPYVPDSLYAELSEMGVSSSWKAMRGKQYLQNSQFKKAAREFIEEVSLHPSFEGFSNLGLAVYQMHRGIIPYDKEIIEKSIVAFNLAIGHFPEHAPFYLNLGMAQCAVGKFPDGLFHFQMALGLNPNFLLAYHNMGKNLWHLKRIEAAIQIFRAGLKRFPDDSYMQESLIWLLSTSKFAKYRDGKAALRLALPLAQKSDFKNPNHLDLLAVAYAANGQFEKAIQIINQAIAIIQGSGPSPFAKAMAKKLPLFKQRKPYLE